MELNYLWHHDIEPYIEHHDKYFFRSLQDKLDGTCFQKQEQGLWRLSAAGPVFIHHCPLSPYRGPHLYHAFCRAYAIQEVLFSTNRSPIIEYACRGTHCAASS